MLVEDASHDGIHGNATKFGKQVPKRIDTL
jgi:hypothetical protein